MFDRAMTLILMPGRMAICRLGPGEPIPGWAVQGDFFSVTRTRSETSIVCEAVAVPGGIEADRGWRAFEVAGPMDLATVGVLAKLSGGLARAGISLFAVSTFDTDYLLVKEENLGEATLALQAEGHAIL